MRHPILLAGALSSFVVPALRGFVRKCLQHNRAQTAIRTTLNYRWRAESRESLVEISVDSNALSSLLPSSPPLLSAAAPLLFIFPPLSSSHFLSSSPAGPPGGTCSLLGSPPGHPAEANVLSSSPLLILFLLSSPHPYPSLLSSPLPSAHFWNAFGSAKIEHQFASASCW